MKNEAGDEHDHREHAVGDRLADVVDIGVLLGDGGRDLGEQPVAVGAESVTMTVVRMGDVPGERVGGNRRLVY